MNAIPNPTLYQRLLDLPENLTGEILQGELHVRPRPRGPHAMAAGGLDYEWSGPFRYGRGGPGGWWILPEPEVHFVRDTEVAVPNLAGWRRERMPAVPVDHRFEVVPDWVCEILSPTTGKQDRAVKLPLFARYGVAFCWLVDPEARTLEAFELREGYWLLLTVLQDDAAVSVRPFEAVSFGLADLGSS